MKLRPRRLLRAMSARLSARGAARDGTPGARPGARVAREGAAGLSARELHRRLGGAVFGVARRDGQLDPLPEDDAPVSARDLGRYLADLQLHVQDLFAPFDPGPTPWREVAASGSGGSFVLELGEGAPAPLVLTLENRGEVPTGPLGIAVNGEDPSSRAGLLALALEGAATPAGRAHAIQRFVCARRVHGPPPTASRDDPEAADPLFFFNAFGYGLCGNAAYAFAALAHAAGLEARVWNVRGHTLPEVSVDGAWRAFDPDAGTWYVEGGLGGEHLSLERLASRAEGVLAGLSLDPIWEPRRAFLAERLADRKAHVQVATGESLRAAQVDAERFASPLAPGERIALFYASQGPWAVHDLVLPAPWSPPPERAHALSTWDLLHPGGLEHAATRGIARSSAGAVASAGAECVLDVTLAGPLLDGALELGSAEARAAAGLDAWIDGAFRPVLFDAVPEGSTLSLRRALVEGRSRRIRVRFEREVALSRFELRVLAQRALRVLPRFRAGANRVELVGASPDHRLELRLGLAEPAAAVAAPEPRVPASGACLALDELQAFRWSGGDGGEVELQVATSASFERPLAPNLERRVAGGELALGDADRAYLKGGDHWWRVRRAGGAGRLPGPWSPAAHFRVRTESVYVRDVNRRLDTGAAHATLGPKPLDPAWFEDSGRETVEWLVEQGLAPGHRCVELGCGSLRVGRWLIAQLEPGGYVGLDVTDRYYRAGMEQLPAGLLEEKRPAFATLGSQEAERLSRAGFDVLVSTGVVMHIPEAELGAYFDNVARLLHPEGVAYISFKETEESRQTGPMTWSHSQKAVLEQAAAHGLLGEVVRSPVIEASAGFAEGIRLGILRLRRAD